MRPRLLFFSTRRSGLATPSYRRQRLTASGLESQSLLCGWGGQDREALPARAEGVPDLLATMG